MRRSERRWHEQCEPWASELMTVEQMTHPRNHIAAFTRIELLMVALTLVALIAVLIPQMIQRKRSAQLTACSGNLKQVALGISFIYMITL